MSGQFLDEEVQFLEYIALDKKTLGSPRSVTYSQCPTDDSEQNELF